MSDEQHGKYRTEFKPRAQEDLRKIPKDQAMVILRKLTELEKDPYGYGTTSLVGDPAVRRLRVGDRRVLYTVENGVLIVWVLRIGQRDMIYGTDR
ncbi:type II toxin-antitoxin system RelE family toxin [Streptacidiphilus fuscans]|uniref:Type II toxin-antitoxin system RelE/ParE family toxin n=1 Tax=Streptacidiphilus fuscans TaxID=2789292 RepID=A0A931B9V6_9ACTN|nr:type II toxin-antitoxin system RelE/ParE family toxin [Streptacidiphilus fuscans]MBF9073930.1 type II toxin-antitoxin system RelE/ParE family toxin [Streptacidiphilus fuscans]